MSRIAASLILTAALGAGSLPALAASEGATLDGHWMAIGDMLGLLPGHIESLTIDGDRAVSVLWRSGDCASGDGAPACSLPLAATSGHFAGTSFDLSVTADAGAAMPFAAPESALWPLFALEGAPWQTFWQGDRLMIVREAGIEGTTVPLMRIWLRTEPELPGQLFDFLVANELGIARSICPVVTLRGDPGAWEGFTAYLAATAAPNHDLRLWRSGLGTPPALADLAAGDASAYGEAAAAAFARGHGWQQGTGAVPDGLQLLAAFPYPAAPALVAATADCDARLFGG